MSTATDLYREFAELDLLEDRREYTVEDLMSSECISREDAEELYKLIQADFEIGG